MKILCERIRDQRTLALLAEVIRSFSSTSHGKGLPLGNLTSQLLVNVYMNEFDQFVKHDLRVRYYLRYADDFAVLSEDREELLALVPRMAEFLKHTLALSLHPNKVSIKTLASGVDFLGWVHFPDHRVVRTSTKRRMLRRLQESAENSSVRNSYVGMLRHGNTFTLRDKSGLAAYEPAQFTQELGESDQR